jgi:hypothetical protein
MQMLYVDMSICGEMNRERRHGPLQFWTKDMLSRREAYEIANGGFGRATLRDSFKHDEHKTDDMDVETEDKKKDENEIVSNEGSPFEVRKILNIE